MQFLYCALTLCYNPRRKITIFQTIRYKRILHIYQDYKTTQSIINDPNLTQKVDTLCQGLDSASRTIVARILSRLRTLYNNKQQTYSLLSQEEINELARIRAEFYARIYEIAPNLYCYNGYFFSTYFFEVSVLWHKHNLSIFSPSTLQAMKEKDIIDVGACIGDSSLVFQDFTNNNIYAFEPTNDNYNHLLQTISLNNTTRIIPVKKALGATAHQAQISIKGGASSIVFDNHTTSHSIEVITLDSFVQSHNLKIGFIKVDIEGFEQEFLKGAKQTICTQKPAMLISIYHTADDFFLIKPMIDSWNLGYTFKIIKPIDFSVLSETALYCEVQSKN